MFELADVDYPVVRAEVDEASAERLSVGMAATLEPITGGGATYGGRIVRESVRLEKRTIGLAEPGDPPIRAIWVDVDWAASGGKPPPLGAVQELWNALRMETSWKDEVR